MNTTQDLLNQLNALDECATIEAKRGTGIDKSILETVCSFSNEPGLGGGYILLGVVRDDSFLFPQYKAEGITNTDKLQSDLASRCATDFNIPVRPELSVERINGVSVLRIYVPELPAAQKPLYFKSRGLPSGAFRRIGSTDQQCGDDDLIVFYNHNDTFDATIAEDTSINDVEPEALKLYRTFRERVNPMAEELSYSDSELLISLGCAKIKKDVWKLTIGGLMLFGKSSSQRRLYPMMRIDYIRVPGNEWVADPDNRFTTIDMRGPLLTIVQRIYSAVIDDLPQGFLLPEGELQTQHTGLPGRVLREVLVNALMHRSFKLQQPVQVIRYGNRLEIKNPGFSLKPEDQLGEPGSQTRNPFIAAVFHETNLAETKGSGIRTMRKLLQQAGLAPPTFESDHGSNLFTARLLLHHFLSEDDLVWLKKFERFSLNENQKRGLVFLREVGAIDNQTFRQINGCDIFKASTDLRTLRDFGLVEQKGRGRNTYYITTETFAAVLSAPVPGNPTGSKGADNVPVNGNGALSAPVHTSGSAPVPPLVHQLPYNLEELRKQIGKRTQEPQLIEDFILQLCALRDYRLQEIANILERQPKYILKEFIQPMLKQEKIEYTKPDMPNHPNQSYRTKA